MLFELVRPPPHKTLNVRYRLYEVIDEIYGKRNMLELLASHRFQFFQVTGETPETFLNLLGILNVRGYRSHTFSTKNRVLLVVIWLLTYPTYMMLSSIFNVSVTMVRKEIQLLLPHMFLRLRQYVSWPSVD